MNPELKSSEECENDRLTLIGMLSYCAETKDWKRFEQLLKAHELNAYKAGMTEAAEIVKDGNALLTHNSCDETIRKAILYARDRKESL